MTWNVTKLKEFWVGTLFNNLQLTFYISTCGTKLEETISCFRCMIFFSFQLQNFTTETQKLHFLPQTFSIQNCNLFLRKFSTAKSSLWLHECNFSSPCKRSLFHSTFSYRTTAKAFPRALDRFSDWMESRLAWKTNQIKINKHFELGNYWLSAVAVAVDCLRSQINRRWMSSTKSENKPRSAVNSSILLWVFPAACDLWTHFLCLPAMMWKKFIIYRNSKEGREKLMAINKRKTLPINAIKHKRLLHRSKVSEIGFNHVRLQIVGKTKMAIFSVTIDDNNKASDIFEFTPWSNLDSQTNLCTLGRDENQQSPPRTKWHVINAEKCCREPLTLQLCCCWYRRGKQI